MKYTQPPDHSTGLPKVITLTAAPVNWGSGGRPMTESWESADAIIIQTATVLVFERICYEQSR